MFSLSNSLCYSNSWPSNVIMFDSKKLYKIVNATILHVSISYSATGTGSAFPNEIFVSFSFSVENAHVWHRTSETSHTWRYWWTCQWGRRCPLPDVLAHWHRQSYEYNGPLWRCRKTIQQHEGLVQITQTVNQSTRMEECSPSHSYELWKK